MKSCRSGVQADDRSVRGSVDIRSRVLGVLKKGDTVYNAVKGKKERIGRIVQMHANNRQEVEEIRAGDIAACVGLKEVTTGETLCDPSAIITLEKMVFPEPVIAQAVEPKTKTDQEKGIALNRLAAEDLSFRVRTDEESGQTIIAGMGELHLEIIVDRMEARIRCGSQRRQASGGLPRNHPRHRGRSRRQVRAPVRW